MGKVTTGRRESRGWHVLLADDNDDHALLIQMALERVAEGPIRIRRARDGDEALAMVGEEVPDLLLLDLNMPGRSGHEVLQQLKGSQEFRAIPVAVLTSSDRDEDMAESYGLGGNHFITKPGNPAELELRLRSLFRNLSELEGIRRGTRGVTATAGSAEGPRSYLLKRLLPAVGFLLLLSALMMWAWQSGIMAN